MQRPRIKIIPLLIYVLSLSSQACLLEQAIALVLRPASHDHHTVDTQKQSQPTPSHKHDTEGHESEFCCDNNLNFYIKSKILIRVDSIEQLDSISLSKSIVDFKEQTNSFQYSYNLHCLKTPNSPRARDQYALTCLLHAPPCA